jgi:hypothetical protein
MNEERLKTIYKKLKEEKEWLKVVTSIGDVVKTKAVFPKDAKDLDIAEGDISRA